MKKKHIVLLMVILAMFILVMIHVTKRTTNLDPIANPETCASQWVQDDITVEETLGCIEKYVEKEQSEMQDQKP